MIEVYIEHGVFKHTLASFTDKIKEIATLYLVGDTYDEGLQLSEKLWDLEAVEGLPSPEDTEADVIFNVIDDGTDNETCDNRGSKTIWTISATSLPKIDALTGNIRQKVKWGESGEALPDAPIDNTRKESNPKDAVGCLKTPAHVVPPRVLAEVGLALLEGAMKYSSYNYRVVGVRASIYFDSVSRHLNSFWEGEDIDKDSGLSHVTKAISALIVLRDSMIGGNWTDDRPPAGNIDYEELNKKAAAIIEKYKHLNMQPCTQKEKV
jgi:hypothetical protein